LKETNWEQARTTASDFAQAVA